MKKLFALLLCLVLALASLPVFAEGDYTLEQVTILSRHNIRAPLSTTGSVLETATTHTWTDWTSNGSELTLLGGVQETAMGQYFRKYMESEGLIENNWIPEEGQTRFYANSLQRTIATAQYFSSGFLPVANVEIEHHCDLGTMDPVFVPVLTYMSDDYREQALAEMAARCDLNDYADAIALIEDVIDFENSAYAAENGITALPLDDVAFTAEQGDEPNTIGTLNIANSLSDGLTLQYYETGSAFGTELSFEDLCKIGSLNDLYTDVLFCAPCVAVNVAHPILVELESEMLTEGRVFSFLCGHDSTIASTLAALKAEDYTLPESISAHTPIGGKLVFERWLGADGEDYMTVSMVYLTADQLVDPYTLVGDNEPMKYALSLEGLERNADGYYRYDDVLARFDESIAAYDALAADMDAAA